MGERGPAPKPTALKLLNGNPGKRPINSNEPRPAIRGKIPPAPRFLSDEARKEWRRVAKHLWPVGLLTDADADALAIYCETFSTWRRAEERVRNEGEVIQTTNGNWVQNPFLSIANKAKRDLVLLAREFGMTPAARSRIAIAPAEDESSVADALFSLVNGG